MTREELKKEAKEYADWFWGASPSMMKALAEAYIKGAEPREKQIQIDAEQIRALQKQNGELTDENERLKGDLELWETGACRATNLDKCGVVKELEAQIEKMKCCEMCKHKNFNWGFSPICEARDKIKIKNPLTCKCDKWEIKK